MAKHRYDDVMEEIFRIFQNAGLKPKKVSCVSDEGKEVPEYCPLCKYPREYFKHYCKIK